MRRIFSMGTVLAFTICTAPNSWAATSADEGTFTSVFMYVFIGYCSLVALTHVIEFIRLRSSKSGKPETLAAETSGSST